ncbi:MAG: 16S rRNA (cytidine(1402)-2'-O)-methyltransferase [Candidatus Makana argininalis]
MNKFKKENILKSTLYIVPTPIGNIKDITIRALLILKKVDLIASEDTRITNILLNFFSIKNNIFSFNKFNEIKKTKFFISKLKQGKSIAIVSNAGTPIINDPGYFMVKSCYKLGFRVIPLPGACAAITALSGSGIQSNRFCFEGFVPYKKKERKILIKSLKEETRTLIFYETSLRIIKTIKYMEKYFGSFRYIVIARELTKYWETICGSTIKKILNWLKKDKKRYKGEMSIIVEGYKKIKKENNINKNVLNTFKLLLNELTFKKSIKLTSNIYFIKKNLLYKNLLKYKKN